MDNNNDLVKPQYAGEQQEHIGGVSEDQFQNSVSSQFQTAGQQARWVKELDASRKEHSDFVRSGFKTIDIYADKRDATSKRSNYNVFFANTEIKQAAMYAQTPKPDIKRRFNDPDDQASRVGAEILSRNIEFELDVDGFDSKIKQILFDRLVPGLGVGWVRYEKEGGENIQHEVPHPQAGQMIPHPEDPSQMVQAPDTMMVDTTSPVIHECAEIDYVAWDDLLWSPCRTWDLCRWLGRRISMSQEAVKDRFGTTVDPKVLSSLSYEKDTGEQKKGDQRKSTPKHNVESTTDVFEIWDKEQGLIWWISESADVPLDVREDTNQFDGFFPTPIPPLGRVSTSNTIPISDYSEVQDLYRELDTLSHRCSSLTQAMQLKWVYNNGNRPVWAHSALRLESGVSISK